MFRWYAGRTGGMVPHEAFLVGATGSGMGRGRKEVERDSSWKSFTGWNQWPHGVAILGDP